ncbi:MAG TPA: hypothetical protein VKM94_25870 [Blastocatellia bacterium]|nr:hypothetical protein [Blastocatellia bacterium]
MISTLKALSMILLFSVAGFAQDKKPTQKPLSQEELNKMDAHAMRPPTGASFYIEAIKDAMGQYSVLLGDSNNRIVTGTYQGSEIAAFEAVLSSAVDFARTDEAVGQTSRFADKTTKSVFVDVEKTPKASKYWVTLIYGRSKVTVDCGALDRSGKAVSRSALILDILEKVKTARANAPSQ